MKVTKITQQQKQNTRYSIFVDDKYSFSLSEKALLDSGLTSGQELTIEKVKEYKQLSSDDKLYNRALNYVVLRPRSVWELQFYLRRKDSPAPLIEQITNKLLELGLLDDRKFAQMFVHDRALLRPASRRKMIMELRKKHVPEEVIQLTLEAEPTDELAALRNIVAKKRELSKFKNDELKLMQYLARQGFSYSDIKQVLGES
ncbi:recombination regulator RecX [soil metagenome]